MIVIPLRKLPPEIREEEREQRAILREQRKLERCKQRDRGQHHRERRQREYNSLPSFLRVPRPRRARLIASGIALGYLTRCCDTGCVHCEFIGWRRAKNGTIVDVRPVFYTTGQWAREHNCSYKTIARRCDEGNLLSFKVPGSNRRYVIDPDDYEKLTGQSDE